MNYQSHCSVASVEHVLSSSPTHLHSFSWEPMANVVYGARWSVDEMVKRLQTAMDDAEQAEDAPQMPAVHAPVNAAAAGPSTSKNASAKLALKKPEFKKPKSVGKKSA